MKKYSASALIFLITCSFFSNPTKAQLKAGFTISSSTGCSPLSENFVNTTTGGTGTYTYSWNFGDGDTSNGMSPSYTYGSVYSSTSYKVTLRVRDASNNIDSITKTIIVFPTPRPDLGPDQRGCWGNPILLSTGLLHQAIVNWTWIQGTDTVKNALHGDSIYVDDSGKYAVKVLNSYGCIGTDTANIYFNPLVKAKKVDTTVCIGDSVRLRAGIGGASASYVWFDRIHNNKILGTAPNFSFFASGVAGYSHAADFGIIISQTAHGLTCADTGYYNITINTPIHPVFNKIPPKCISDPAFQLYGGPPYVDPAHQNGTWIYPKNPSAIVGNFLYPSVMGITFGDSSLGWIHYLYYNQYNCFTDDSIKVTIFGLPTVNAGHDTEICTKNGKYLLNNSYVSPPGGSWFAEQGTPTDAVVYSVNHDSVFFNPNAAGIIDSVYGIVYNIKAPLPNPCSNSDTVFIKVVNSCASGIKENTNPGLAVSVYPNPFSSSAIIQYNLIKPSKVTIALFDMAGKQIAAIKNESEESGSYEVEINSEKYRMPPGVYLLKFMTDDGFVSRQIVKL